MELLNLILSLLALGTAITALAAVRSKTNR